MSDRRRAAREERAAAREAARKRATRMELLKRLGLGLGIGVAIIVVLVITQFLGSRPESQPPRYEQYRAQETACGAEAPDPQITDSFPEPEPQADLAEAATVTASIATSCGPIEIEMEPTNRSVQSFVFLARSGYYDGSVFHRVADGIGVFGGDHEADGTGNPGYRVPDDFPPNDYQFEPGVVALDNRGPGTSGSTILITSGERAAALPNTHNIIGRVTEGMDTITTMEEVPAQPQVGRAEQSRPLETIYIESVEITVE